MYTFLICSICYVIGHAIGHAAGGMIIEQITRGLETPEETD